VKRRSRKRAGGDSGSDEMTEEETKPQSPAYPDNIRLAYTELCNSYRAIDDFRAKLLAALPLASGTGIFLLYSEESSQEYLLPIGIFGCIITLGLFAFEIYGIKKCACIISAGIFMEKKMGIPGQFRNRPRAVKMPIHYLDINEPLASGIIYPAVLAAWTFLALNTLPDQTPGLYAIFVFLLFFLLSIRYNKKLLLPESEKDCEEEIVTTAIPR
jgi:hypothetical protein